MHGKKDSSKGQSDYNILDYKRFYYHNQLRITADVIAKTIINKDDNETIVEEPSKYFLEM